MEREPERRGEGQPDAGEGPSNPDESVPSEADLAEELPGVPDEARAETDEDNTS